MTYKNKEQQRQYQRQWIANRRIEYFKDKYCVQCGSTEQLELDHINRKTKVDHRIWSWSKTKRDEELAKCQVLCRDCHKLKTKLENIIQIHGLSMYKYHGCKCDICKQAKRIENSKRYASLA